MTALADTGVTRLAPCEWIGLGYSTGLAMPTPNGASTGCGTVRSSRDGELAAGARVFDANSPLFVAQYDPVARGGLREVARMVV